MNCLIANESIAAAEAAIRRLEARYEADPTLFDDPSLAPLGHPSEESVRKHFDLLRRLTNEEPDLDDVKWLEDGRIYEESDDGRKALRVATHTMPPNILEIMRRLLLEELENQETACRRLCHAIDRHQAIKG